MQTSNQSLFLTDESATQYCKRLGLESPTPPPYSATRCIGYIFRGLFSGLRRVLGFLQNKAIQTETLPPPAFCYRKDKKNNVKPISETEHSFGVEDDRLTSSPKYPGFPHAELPECVYGLHQVGLPHPGAHEGEDES